MASPRHVLIIGGGLAGPCLALALAKHQIKATVYELRPNMSSGGGSISLPPSALMVLDRHAGIYQDIRKQGFEYTRMGAYSEDGEKFGEILAGQEGEGKYPALRMMRTALQKSLLDECERRGISVNYDKKLRDIKEDGEGVTAIFEDGMEATGDILIGADGARSKVRQHVLRPNAPEPTYAGICVVTGFVPASQVVLPDPDFTFPAFVFNPYGAFMACPIDPEGKTLAWGINREDPDRSREEWKEYESSGQAARNAKADYAEFTCQPTRSMLDNAKDEDAKLWATYSIPDIKTWHTKRVCLIGDAAHAIPPNGQGTGLAFEDVALLTRMIATKGGRSYDEVFERFQTLRKPRINGMRESQKTAGTLKRRAGDWVWWMKKWGMRAFFWFKGGLVRHYKDHDVDKVDIGW